MRIALTGVTGTLGRAIVERFSTHHEIIPIGRDRIDLENIVDVYKFFLELDADFIIHTGALTGVDLCETEKEKAIKINWLATRAIVRAVEKRGIPIIYLSTDYVFDGEKEYYDEWDSPNPICFYGKTKYFGEREVIHSTQSHYIVRSSWIFGKGGKNFFSRLPQLLKTGRVKAVLDQWSAPTYAPDLAEAIFKIVNEKPPYGIYHAPGSEGATPFTVAKEVSSILNIDAEIVSIRWQDLKLPAKRPRHSLLMNNALKYFLGFELPSWRESIRRYLNEG
jgi:dTDP-4-dehydrorhamnose reductase